EYTDGILWVLAGSVRWVCIAISITGVWPHPRRWSSAPSVEPCPAWLLRWPPRARCINKVERIIGPITYGCAQRPGLYQYSVGGNQRTFIIGCSRPTMLRPVSLGPLLTEMCSLRWRQPRPFRASRADGYPGRPSIEDPFFHQIRTDCLGHATSLAKSG